MKCHLKRQPDYELDSLSSSYLTNDQFTLSLSELSSRLSRVGLTASLSKPMSYPVHRPHSIEDVRSLYVFVEGYRRQTEALIEINKSALNKFGSYLTAMGEQLVESQANTKKLKNQNSKLKEIIKSLRTDLYSNNSDLKRVMSARSPFHRGNVHQDCDLIDNPSLLTDTTWQESHCANSQLQALANKVKEIQRQLQQERQTKVNKEQEKQILLQMMRPYQGCRAKSSLAEIPIERVNNASNARQGLKTQRSQENQPLKYNAPTERRKLDKNERGDRKPFHSPDVLRF